mmetsp:Transcript_1272/g.5314  ORF Transcript_1272/g.5314 Transcript_1272/m.5314 type:complete len:232 (+) Transcript_1272:2427-3122(+)
MPPIPRRAETVGGATGRNDRSGASPSSSPSPPSPTQRTSHRFRVNQSSPFFFAGLSFSSPSPSPSPSPSSPSSSKATRWRHPPRDILTSTTTPRNHRGGLFGGPPSTSGAPFGPALGLRRTARPTSAAARASTSSAALFRSTSRSMARPASAARPVRRRRSSASSRSRLGFSFFALSSSPAREGSFFFAPLRGAGTTSSTKPLRSSQSPSGVSISSGTGSTSSSPEATRAA